MEEPQPRPPPAPPPPPPPPRPEPQVQRGPPAAGDGARPPDLPVAPPPPELPGRPEAGPAAAGDLPGNAGARSAARRRVSAPPARAPAEGLRRSSDAASARSSASAASSSAAAAADFEKLRHVRQTKNLFNEGQKIAYVGLCQLAVRERKCERYVPFPNESGAGAPSAPAGPGGKGKKDSKKKAGQFPSECAAACESYDYWGRKFMRQLFQHMDISPSEQEMIVQLGEHGVTARDMAESLTGEILLDPKYADHVRNASRDSIDSTSQASGDLTPPASEATDAEYAATSPDGCLVRSNASSPGAEVPAGDETPAGKDGGLGILARPEDAAGGRTDEEAPATREPGTPRCETADGAPAQSAVEGGPDSPAGARGSPGGAVPDAEVRPLTSKNLALMEASQEPAADEGAPSDICELQSSPPALIVQSKCAPSDATKGSAASASSEDDAEVDDRVRLDIRFTIACDLFLLLIDHGVYDSRSRDFLRTVAAKKLGLDWSMLTRFERRVAEQLQLTDVADTPTEGANRETTRRRTQKEKRRRLLMMGLASIGGSLMIGLTAGLAAPVIGAGLGAAFTTIGVSGTTAFLGGTGGAALITTGAALTGGGLAAKGMANRTRGVSTFEFVPIHDRRRVALLIGVCGWAATTGSAKDQSLPFSTVDPRWAGDVAAVRWEPEMLLELGSALKLIAGEVLSFAAQEVLRHTMLSVVMAGLAWPMTLTKLGYLVDNPWFVGLDRAARAGLVLADTLLARTTGSRPVTLAGYSLGARVIFFALLELARVHAFGIVEDAYLFGGPLTPTTREWQQAACVVAGKLVNGYVRSDWVLGFLFRATTGGLRNVAGLHPAPDLPGIVSEDVSHLVNGHMQYRASMPRLLRLCGVIITSETFEEENEQEKEILEAEKEHDAAGAKDGPPPAEGEKDPRSGAAGQAASTPAPVWDLEEIKRELADFDTHVRELPSSLPQLVVNTASAEPDAQQGAGLEEARKELASLDTQIRELPSSMPPLVLNADQEARPSSGDC